MIREYLRELQKVQLLSPSQEKNLWDRYKRAGDQHCRAELIEAYQPLVIKIVSGLGAGLAQELAMDLIQEGTVGLIEAVENFDHARGVAFPTFAWPRIKGRIINYLRVHLKEMNQLVSWEETVAADDSLEEGMFHDPAAAVEKWDVITRLAGAWRRLPPKERAVMAALYVEDQPADKAASRLQISSSHFYRLQRQALRRMRGILSREAPGLREG